MIVVPGYHDPKQNQTPSAAKKKDFVTLVDVAGKEHTINVRANGERLQLGAIVEIELQAGDRLWLQGQFFWRHQWHTCNFGSLARDVAL